MVAAASKGHLAISVSTSGNLKFPAGGAPFETSLIFRVAAPSSAVAERGGGFGEGMVRPETRRGGGLPAFRFVASYIENPSGL